MTDEQRSQQVKPHPTLTRYYDDDQSRRPYLGGLFDRTAKHYNLINRMMSFGTGERYRRDAMLRAELAAGMTVLDLCIGTGQVARPALSIVGEAGSVIGLDASFGMLRESQQTVTAPLLQSYVEQLPVADESVDFITMGYALRHMADLVIAFREIGRVLRPGGTVLILEMTRPHSKLMYQIARFYLQRVVPTMARLRTGDREAKTLMRYFWDTIEACVPPASIVEALTKAGLRQASWSLMYGFFSEYTAVKE